MSDFISVQSLCFRNEFRPHAASIYGNFLLFALSYFTVQHTLYLPRNEFVESTQKFCYQFSDKIFYLMCVKLDSYSNT
jgi:hypothetical protein